MICLFTASSSFAAVVINEVLYDPQGTDTGNEWVELYNTGDVIVSLDGWALQKDNNEVWSDSTTAVAASLSGAIGPKSFYLISDSTAAPLSLGNASSKAEGIRLLDASSPSAFTVEDTLVYGTPDEDGLGAEGGTGGEAPAVKSGSSLARVSDGRDTQNNAADFLEDPTPTPGAANDPAGVARLDEAGSISYPNPFLPARHASVTFTTPERVLGPLSEIRIYNAAGELVRSLKQSTWDGRNDDGDAVASGLYYYVLETGRGKARGKVTLIR